MTTPVNASQMPDGSMLARPVYLVDNSGNPISSANGLQTQGSSGGTQYTDGGTPPAHPIGAAIVFNNSGTWAVVSASSGLPITGSITATNPSVGSTGAGIPASATMVGASDGTNLQQLLVESAAQRNLRIGIYQAGNEAAVTGANALKVDGSAVTQPVSGTFWQATQPVSGTVAVTALPTGSNTIGGVKLIDTGGTNVASISASGAVKVDNSAVTQPVSGTITANAGTGPFPTAGMIASGATNANNPVKIGAVYNSTQPTVTTGQIVDVQATARGAQIVAPGVDNFGVQLQATAGTALVADQSNSELRVSTYVKTTTAGDTALTVGQATMANSLPVTMASNQGAVSVGPSAGTAFDTNQGTAGANTLRVVSGAAATGTKSNVSSSASSVTILASNTSRKGALFYNDSTQICYLDLSGGTASASSYSVQMPSQSLFELPGPVIYNGLVTGIWASANGTMRVTEFS